MLCYRNILVFNILVLIGYENKLAICLKNFLLRAIYILLKGYHALLWEKKKYVPSSQVAKIILGNKLKYTIFDE